MHHPAIEHILRFFDYDHLPAHLQAASRPFKELALKVVEAAEDNPETMVALRKLLEAKDAAVRALLPVKKETVEDAARRGFHGDAIKGSGG